MKYCTRLKMITLEEQKAEVKKLTIFKELNQVK